MSQAKVDKHKQEKYNRKKNVKKRNFKKIAAYVVARCLYHWRDASGHEAHTAVSSYLSDRRGRFGRYR